MIKEFGLGAAAAALTMEALSGCSTGGELPVTAPNDTYQQVEAVAGWGNTLAGITLSQHMDFTVPTKYGYTQRYEVFNFTTAKVSTASVEAIARYDVGLGDASTSVRFPIEYLEDDGTQEKVTITSDVDDGVTDVHSVVLVPENTNAPSIANNGDSQTVDISRTQSFSVVYRPEDASGNPGSFLKDGSGLTTELLQASLMAIPMQTGSTSNPNEVSRLAQEGIANSLGDEETDIESGDDYSTYVTDETGTAGMVPVGYSDDANFVGGNYYILKFATPLSFFNSMKRALTMRK